MTSFQKQTLIRDISYLRTRYMFLVYYHETAVIPLYMPSINIPKHLNNNSPRRSIYYALFKAVFIVFT